MKQNLKNKQKDKFKRSNLTFQCKTIFFLHYSIPQLSQPIWLQQKELSKLTAFCNNPDFTLNQKALAPPTIMWLRSKSRSFSSSQGRANWNLQDNRTQRILHRSQILDFIGKGDTMREVNPGRSKSQFDPETEPEGPPEGERQRFTC